MAAAAESNPRPDSGEWTVVAPRRRRGSVKHQKKHHPDNETRTTETLPWTPSDSDIDPAMVSKLVQKMRSSMTTLERSGFCKRFLSQLREDPRIRQNLSRVTSSMLSGEGIQVVVYGVGSIDSYEPPRLQLSLALLLGQELSAEVVEVFDPVLSAVECAAVEAMGCRLLAVDESGRRVVKRPTLFYMPHCEAGLYDNLLAANWGRVAAMGRMVVLGNSFAEYGRYVEEGIGAMVVVADKARHVLSARAFVEEIGIGEAGVGEELGKDDVLVRAFNETSWHFFHLDAADISVDGLSL